MSENKRSRFTFQDTHRLTHGTVTSLTFEILSHLKNTNELRVIKKKIRELQMTKRKFTPPALFLLIEKVTNSGT